jgi:transposase
VLRHDHRAGEKLFVDYAGASVPIHHLETGQVWEAAIFVAVLGASNYTYAEASLSQGLADWIGAHMRAFEFIGGVTEIVTPDNLKSGVTKACRYEPSVNRTYEEMAAHYGVAVIPARPRKPRDKTCASYCTLSRFHNGQSWLGRPAAAMSFDNCDIPEWFVQRAVATIVDNPMQKTRSRPFMDGGLRYF